MKQRLSSLDVKVIAHELSNTLTSLRLSNVYDLSSRIFLFKFAKPNHRHSVVVDSGFRCHLTNFNRVTASSPSPFVTRLRKFLRTRRITSVSQVGTDRVIEFRFSDGQYRLFLEFYAGGNVVLTDREYNILALLRIVDEGEEQEELRVGLKYSVENRQNYAGVPPLTEARVRTALQKAQARNASDTAAGSKRSKKAGKDVLRKALASTLAEFPPMLLDHAFRIEQFDPTTTIDSVLESEDVMGKLMAVLRTAAKVVEDVTSAEVSKGYIIAKVSPKAVPSGDLAGNDDKENNNLRYEDFHPFRPEEFKDSPDYEVLEFDGFNKTVDEFFSSIESQKLESRLTEREEAAKRKLENARLDHQKRLGGLQQVQELNVRRAQVIENNLERVAEAITAINSLIGQGMDWVEMQRLIEMEQARGNAVAEMIKLPLKLYENTATLLLPEADYDDEEDYEGDETDSDVSDSEEEDSKTKATKVKKPDDTRMAVDVDLALSPWANARQYYDQKRRFADKEQKTLQSSTKALKSTEKKVAADLKKGLKQEKEVLRTIRRIYWWEKFFFFISTEGYLVLGGRDAQQNDILYNRYLSKGDVYIHADIQGASSVIIKNKPGLADLPIPPSTLSQAGNFCVSTSIAWDSKAVMAAWWVKADQVSKTASNGDYLAQGLFNILGEKNYLPPAQLLLGFGVLFQVTLESMARHNKHRIADSNDSDGKTSVAGESIAHQAKPSTSTDAANDGREVGDSDEETAVDGNESDNEDANDHIEPINVYEDQMGEGDKPILDADDDNEKHELHYANPLLAGGKSLESGVGHGSDLDGGDNTSSAEEKDVFEDAPEGTATVDEASQAGTESGITTPSTASKQPPQAQVRGKHGKKAKLKTKYAHQDEEDRVLALRLLGSTKASEKTLSEAEVKANREVEDAAQKERRREQHVRSQQEGKKAEEERRKRLASGAEAMPEEEVAEMALLQNFVGRPLAGDEIVDCMAVAGPWDALGAKLEWRVKIQPGAVKKGKAVKEILALWQKGVIEAEKRRKTALVAGQEGFDLDKVTRRQGELVKQLRDVEVVGALPVGKCRVVMAGGADKSGGGGGGGVKGKAGGGKGQRGGRGSKRK